MGRVVGDGAGRARSGTRRPWWRPRPGSCSTSGAARATARPPRRGAAVRCGTSRSVGPAYTARRARSAGAGGRGGFQPPVTISNQTLRQVVRVSIGGERLRVVLSNAFGTAPVDIGAAHVALRDHDAMVKPSSVKPLTFGGSEQRQDCAGRHIVSDASISKCRRSAISWSTYIFRESSAPGRRLSRRTTARPRRTICPAAGNHSGEPAMTVERTTGAWFLLARVEVAAKRDAGAIVAFGDSITDGARSTADTNSRWPDHLARRLAARRGPAGGRAERGHQRQPGARRWRRRQRARPVRSRRADADRRDPRHRHGGDQRHRHCARQSDADARRTSSPGTSSSSRGRTRAASRSTAPR